MDWYILGFVQQVYWREQGSRLCCFHWNFWKRLAKPMKIIVFLQENKFVVSTVDKSYRSWTWGHCEGCRWKSTLCNSKSSHCDEIWRHRSRSTLAHYLNQYWLIISKVLWHYSPEDNSQKMLRISIHEMCLEITSLGLQLHSPGANELNKTEKHELTQGANPCRLCHSRLAFSCSWWRHPNGNIFRVTGPLCGEFTGDRWILRTKASDAELW